MANRMICATESCVLRRGMGFGGRTAPLLTPPARRGLTLFRGKAGCVACHNGPLLSDGGFRAVGLGETAAIFDWRW